MSHAESCETLVIGDGPEQVRCGAGLRASPIADEVVKEEQLGWQEEQKATMLDLAQADLITPLTSDSLGLAPLSALELQQLEARPLPRALPPPPLPAPLPAPTPAPI